MVKPVQPEPDTESVSANERLSIVPVTGGEETDEEVRSEPLFIPQDASTKQPAKAQRLALLGPASPDDTQQTDEPASLTEGGGAEPEPAAAVQDPMESLLASVPELQDQVATPTAGEQPEYAGDFFRDCVSCPDMAALAGGAFVMGAGAGEGGRENERPQVSVDIQKRFAIGTREVTFEQWNACVADGGCAEYAPPDFGWGRGAQPVVAVSFDDAQKYVAWLSASTGHRYRLPSEAEWEFAARGGSSSAFSFGDRLSAKNANYDGRYAYRGEKSRPVGRPTVAATYPPNPFGLFDMHGNVWEWTADCWNDSHAGVPVDGAPRTGPPTGGACGSRVLKGGAFNTGGWRLRSAHRIGKPSTVREQEIGFRVARDL
jgi:formylglycine-generating enzyme required for sulfatase activity